MSAFGVAVLAGRFAFGACPAPWFCCGAVALGARLVLRLWRGGCVRFAVGVVVLAGAVGARCARGLRRRGMRNAELGYGDERVRRCGSVGVIAFGARRALWFYRGACCRFAPGVVVLAGRFALGARGGCGDGECGMRNWGTGMSTVGVAVLAGCFASVYVQHCGSVAAICLRFTPVFFLFEEKETACNILRFYSAGSRSPFVRSRCAGAVICICGFTSGLDVSCRRSRRGYRGCGGRGNGVTGLAARRLCAFARAHWL